MYVLICFLCTHALHSTAMGTVKDALGAAYVACIFSILFQACQMYQEWSLVVAYFKADSSKLVKIILEAAVLRDRYCL